MITLTSNQLKSYLRRGVTFNDPVTVTDDLKINPFDKIYTLPDNLTTPKLLIYSKTKINYLPNNLFVKELDVRGFKIKSLPNNYSIENLHIGNNKIESLPNNLSVKNLNISHNRNIKHIPPTINGIELIVVNSDFLPSISYESFQICLTLFKNIICVLEISKLSWVNFSDNIFKQNPHQYNKLATQQFEQRLLLGE